VVPSSVRLPAVERAGSSQLARLVIVATSPAKPATEVEWLPWWVLRKPDTPCAVVRRAVNARAERGASTCGRRAPFCFAAKHRADHASAKSRACMCSRSNCRISRSHDGYAATREAAMAAFATCWRRE